MAGDGSAEFWHLPTARQPGPQSRRRRTARKILVPAMGCAAVVWLAFTIPLVVFVSDLPWWMYVFPAGGLLFAYAAYALWRSHRPRVAEHLELRLSSELVRRGDTLHATLRVVDAEKAGGRIEVGLVCTESYDV